MRDVIVYKLITAVCATYSIVLIVHIARSYGVHL